MINDLEAFYTKTEVFRDPSSILFRSIELRLIKERFSEALKARRVLDLGCGNGAAARIVFERKLKYGLDKSEVFIKSAKRRGVYEKLILAEAEKMPLRKSSCDLVFSNCVIEHIEDLDLALKETSRVLTKNGKFLFTSLTDNFKQYSLFSRLGRGWLKGASRWYGQLRDKRLQHYHGYSLKDWSRRLRQHNLKVVDWFYYLDKETTEYWDWLMLVSYGLRQVSIELDDWVYSHGLRKGIYSKYLKAKAVNSQGAAIGILAQKL